MSAPSGPPAVWLIGENNPYQDNAEDGQRFAMYPDPPESAGGRLCHVILGMTERDYLRSFTRRNLLHQPRWSAPAARAACRALVQQEIPAAGRVLLLGAKVWQAWMEASQVMEPGEKWRPFIEAMPYVVTLPHPSGLSRSWNDPAAIPRARRAVAELAPHLQPLLGRAQRAGQVAVEHIAGPYRDLLQRCVRCGDLITDSRNCTPTLRGFEEGDPVVRIGPGWIVSTHFTDPKVPCRSDA